MIKIFIVIVFIGYSAFADNYSSALSNVKQYNEDIILPTKFQKYSNDIEQVMENMRDRIGVTIGEPYLLTFEISEIGMKDNVMTIYIALELGKYIVSNEERAFFQYLYGDYKKEVLALDDENDTKIQLMHIIQRMLERFKIKYKEAS